MLNFQSAIGNRQPNGFTLIEIIITIVIIGIIATIAAGIILQVVTTYSTEDSRSNARYQAQLAVERMTREIRLIQSQTTVDVPTMTATDLMFCEVTGKAVEFQLAGTVLNRRESATCSPLTWGGWEPLSLSGVNALTFTYQNAAGTSGATAANLWFVVIDVTDQQGPQTFEIRTHVHPMNF